MIEEGLSPELPPASSALTVGFVSQQASEFQADATLRLAQLSTIPSKCFAMCISLSSLNWTRTCDRFVTLTSSRPHLDYCMEPCYRHFCNFVADWSRCGMLHRSRTWLLPLAVSYNCVLVAESRSNATFLLSTIPLFQRFSARVSPPAGLHYACTRLEKLNSSVTCLQVFSIFPCVLGKYVIVVASEKAHQDTLMDPFDLESVLSKSSARSRGSRGE